MTLKRLWDEVKRTRIKVRINKCRKRDVFFVIRHVPGTYCY